MELLGIGANMQGSGNYPNFYFSRDLKGVVGGCIWPQISEDKMVNGGRGFLSPLSAGLYVECGREALKQIMLKQEAIFRDQIYELHRLYKRQREFIAEMKRESRKYDLGITTTQSDFYKSRVSALCAQDAHNFPVYNQLFISSEKTASLLSCLGKNIQTGSETPLNGICSKNPYLSGSKSKNLGNGMFDLGLPTDVKYLNVKDELTNVSEMSSCHLKRMLEVVNISDRKPFHVNHVSLSEKTTVSVDLNDPPIFEEEPGCRSFNLVDAPGQREILFHDLYGKANSKFLGFSEQDVHGRKNGLSTNGSSESISFYDRSKRCQPDKDIANTSLSSSSTSLTMSAQGPMGHHPLDTESSKMLIENAMVAEDDFCSVMNLRSSIGSDSLSPLKGSFCNGSKSEIVKEESRPLFDASENWIGGQIDLNVCINEEFLATPCCSTEMKLEVPVSPGKEKHSSTTGEFGDNQVGSHSLESVEDNGKPLADLNSIAAETLVSISSSVAQTSHIQPSFESLCWFAEIVSSMGADPTKDEVTLKCKDGSDSEELLRDCMDDFEVMTLKLKETEEEGCSLTASNHHEESVKNVSSPSCHLRKGCVRRGERNSFQAEILPSLATLSRYEVTEGIQTIGGLMEVASSHSIAGVTKTTSRSRTAWTRGKKRLCDSSSKTTETVIGSSMDRVSSGNEQENKERKVIVWGNITRRRRGQRYPACNRKIILGQV